MIKKIRILVGDDDPMIVAGLQATLRQYPDLEIIGEVKTPAQVIPLIDTLEPDVVVMDLDWWGDRKAGIEQIKRIRTVHTGVKIIAITAYSELLENAKQAGAHEARRKGFKAQDLAESMRALIQTPDEEPELLPLVEELSEREIEVLRLMAEGLKDREISDKLIISVPTVKSHVRNIMGKLGAKNRTEAVASGFRSNLL